jgi:hypothetical protein
MRAPVLGSGPDAVVAAVAPAPGAARVASAAATWLPEGELVELGPLGPVDVEVEVDRVVVVVASGSGAADVSTHRPEW